MKISTLEKALKLYAASAECDCLEDVLDSLKVCAATYERSSDYDYGDRRMDVTLITDGTLDDMLNALTYDIIGKRLRIHGNSLHFEYYAHDVRNQITYLEGLTDYQLMIGYEILSSLWHDNEELGSNNPDGTFSHEPKAYKAPKISKKDKQRAQELLATAKASNDNKDAWTLVDFLYDTNLLT